MWAVGVFGGVRTRAHMSRRPSLHTIGDAVHLATAVIAGADRFVTNNARDFPAEIREVITCPVDLPGPDG